jgi:hypothetical protein
VREEAAVSVHLLECRLNRRQLLRLGALAPLAPKVIAALPVERMPAPFTTLRLRQREPMTAITFTVVYEMGMSWGQSLSRIVRKGDPIE